MSKLPHSIGPLLVDEPDISRAWAKAVLHVIDHAGPEISPLILSVTGFDERGAASETPAIREALDALLLAKRMRSVDDVAFTIFPQRLWQVAQGDRAALFRYYKEHFGWAPPEQDTCAKSCRRRVAADTLRQPALRRGRGDRGAGRRRADAADHARPSQ